MLSSRRLPVWIVAIIASLLLGGCGLSLAEDVTPPPNYRPPTQAPEQPASADVFPVVPPDPAQGRAIYVEKCQACHGAAGMGDGEQADKLPNPAAPIGSAELADQSAPIDWFNIVTNGNLEKFMPGFSGSLNDRQRWDVVAYSFSLSTTQEELEAGKAAYDANCAACHGVTGRGDGEQAASLSPKPASWDDQSLLAKLSADNIAAVIRGEQASHPSFAGQLDEAQQYAVAAHLRQLSFSAGGGSQQGVAAAQTPEAGTPEALTVETGTPAAETPQSGTPGAEGTAAPEDLILSNITITGKVTNATPGGAIPEGMEVLVTAYAGMSPAFELTAPVDKDGNYIINDVEFNPELVYIAQVDANGLTFNSDILHGADVSSPIADLSLKIYDTTTDTTDLRTDRLHVFFDFTNPGTVQVVNLFIISNVGDRIVAGQDDAPVVQFPVPEGATNLAFQDGKMGDRYVETDNGFGDRMSIAPGIGQHQILYAYEMPYDRSLKLNLTVPLPVDAAIVMVPPAGVRLKSNQLTDAGQRSVQGMAFQMYQANAALKAGDTLQLNLSGRVGSGASEIGEDSMLYVLVGGGVFGVALAAAGFWLYRRRQSEAAEDADEELPVDAVEAETSESLLEAIVALDDQHAAGGLPEEAYQERRADLKARLAEAVLREKGE